MWRVLGGVGLGLLVLGATGTAAQPLPPARACQDDRDHLRVLVKMVADGRGQAEWALAEALAKQTRLEEELKMLREVVRKLTPPAPEKQTP